MKKIYKIRWIPIGTLFLALATAVAVLTFNACKKSPTDGVGIIINASIIKYQVLVDISDAANAATVPANATMEVSGRDGDYVYEISGKKSFKLSHGKIDIGLNPVLVPTNSNPSKFVINITAPGYLPLSQEVTINGDQKAQVYKLKLINLTSPPAHHHFVVQDLNMVNGALADQTSIKVGVGGVVGNSVPTIPTLKTLATTQDVTYYDDALTSVVLPKDTRFYYYKPSTQTSTATGTGTQVVQGKDTTVTENGVSKRLQTYYEKEYTYTYTYTTTTYVKTIIPTQATVQTILWYINGISYDFRIYDYAYQQPSTHPIQILNKSLVNEDELLYQTAVKQKLNNIYFVANWTDADGSHTYSVSPDQAVNWFTSYLIDPNTVNPNTGNKVQAGDSVEIAMDATVNYKTERTVVRQATNGQLRVQHQGYDAGFYYAAAYKQTYNYTVNTNLSAVEPSVTNNYGNNDYSYVPDPENINSSISLYPFGKAGASVYGLYTGYNNGTRQFSGKICSAKPLSLYSETNVSYCGAYNYVKPINNGGSADLFTGTFSNLNPVITFDVSLICPAADNNKTFKPSGFGVSSLYGNVYDNSYGGQPYFYVYLNNGIWKTKGLAQGATFYTGFVIGSDGFSHPDKINGTYYEEKFYFNRGSSVCGNF